MTAMRWVSTSASFLVVVKCLGLAADRVCRFAVFEDVDDGLGGCQTGPCPCLDRLSGEVGGDEHVVQAPKGAVAGQGFTLEHVQRGAGDAGSHLGKRFGASDEHHERLFQ
jgi:hypothetical protein